MDVVDDHDGTGHDVPSLAGTVLDGQTLDDLMQKVTALARHVLATAHSISVTVVDDGRYRTSSCTAEEALALDLAQYEGDEGPCLEALRTVRQVRLEIGRDGERWPAFEERARELGILSVLSTPLAPSSDSALGALNVYGREPDRFGERERESAVVLAEHAALLVRNTFALLATVHLSEQLRVALASREIIGQAKGIIMERQRCTRDEAFDILRRASQRENRKVRDLAEELVLRVERRREGQAGP